MQEIQANIIRKHYLRHITNYFLKQVAIAIVRAHYQVPNTIRIHIEHNQSVL